MVSLILSLVAKLELVDRLSEANVGVFSWVQTKVPAKTEKAPTKIATSNQKERLNGTSRAFSPSKVPR